MSENLNNDGATTNVGECNVFGVVGSNGEELGGVEENLGSGVAATIVQNLSSAPSASTVEKSSGSGVATTVEQNFNSDGGGVSASGEYILGSDCYASSHGEQNLGGTSFVTASDVSIISSDWESESDDTANSDYEDFFYESDDEYSSDVHNEVRVLREEKRVVKKKISEEKKGKKKEPRTEGRWFIRLVKNDLELGDGSEVTTITDMQKGHNKKGCYLATSSTKSSVGSSVAAGTRRERPRRSTKVTIDLSFATASRGKRVDVVTAGRGGKAVAAGRGKGVNVVAAGRGRGTVILGRGRAAAAASRGKRVAATATIDGVGRGRGPSADVIVGSIGRGRGVTPTAGVGRGKGAPFKRPRMVGMGPGMPMNSSIVNGYLGHHKPKSGVKWKGKKVMTQQNLEVMRAQKRIRTRSNAAEVNYLSQTSLSTFQ
ncbi:hypothetical protein FXO37_31806 [Capsicum annuum]|nr:hypothetical protein FXO37_31806 [Capsicum annuum]